MRSDKERGGKLPKVTNIIGGRSRIVPLYWPYVNTKGEGQPQSEPCDAGPPGGPPMYAHALGGQVNIEAPVSPHGNLTLTFTQLVLITDFMAYEH